MLCGTQWIYAGMAGLRVGLDHKAVRANMKTMGVERSRRRDLFLDISVMERAALEVFSDRANADANR